METETTKIAVGVLLLMISSVLMVGTGLEGLALPTFASSIAGLGLAVRSVLLGTVEDKRPA